MDITDFKYNEVLILQVGYKLYITVSAVGVKPETAKCESDAKCGDICVEPN